MTLKRKLTLAIFPLALLVLLAVRCGTPNQEAEQAMKVFDQFVERLRWSRYWLGATSMDDIYVEGKLISALVFWTKTNHRPKRGLCSSDLSLCIANYSGSYNRGVAQVHIDRGLAPQLAFASFANANFGDGGAWFPPLSPDDFEFEEKTITLPPLGLPSSILHRVVPEEASREAERIRQQFVCWGVDTKRLPGCTGTLVFAYYANDDPSWYVLRTCSSACEPEFRGDSIESLTRREWGWTITVGGFMNSPKEDIERVKRKIEKAEMFRFELQ